MYEGSLRILVLKALAHHEMSGYGIMIFLQRATGKRPSTGSVYPLLDSLKKDGLVSVKEEEKSKIYSLTKEGKAATKASLCQADDLHQRLGQTLKMFCTMIEDKEMDQVKEMISLLMKSPSKAATFQHEMLTLKSELFRLIRQDDKENIIKAKKIIMDSSNRLKKLA